MKKCSFSGPSLPRSFAQMSFLASAKHKVLFSSHGSLEAIMSDVLEDISSCDPTYIEPSFVLVIAILETMRVVTHRNKMYSEFIKEGMPDPSSIGMQKLFERRSDNPNSIIYDAHIHKGNENDVGNKNSGNSNGVFITESSMESFSLENKNLSIANQKGTSIYPSQSRNNTLLQEMYQNIQRYELLIVRIPRFMRFILTMYEKNKQKIQEWMERIFYNMLYFRFTSKEGQLLLIAREIMTNKDIDQLIVPNNHGSSHPFDLDFYEKLSGSAFEKMPHEFYVDIMSALSNMIDTLRLIKTHIIIKKYAVKLYNFIVQLIFNITEKEEEAEEEDKDRYLSPGEQIYSSDFNMFVQKVKLSSLFHNEMQYLVETGKNIDLDDPIVRYTYESYLRDESLYRNSTGTFLDHLRILQETQERILDIMDKHFVYIGLMQCNFAPLYYRGRSDQYMKKETNATQLLDSEIGATILLPPDLAKEAYSILFPEINVHLL